MILQHTTSKPPSLIIIPLLCNAGAVWLMQSKRYVSRLFNDKKYRTGLYRT
jgi:hypothetical protein